MDETPYYRSDGDAFVATELTRGPWTRGHQHAGPPTALLGRAAERLCPTLHLARLSAELLRPVPIGPMQVVAEIEKAGSKVTLVRAQLLDANTGRVCIHARFGLLRGAGGAPDVRHALDVDGPSPADAQPYNFTFFPWETGYHTSIELRLHSGTWGEGKMGLWMRQRVKLVDDEQPTGAQRALVLADAGSGVSAALDPKRFTFANADLSVHLLRAPRGEWLLLRARTSIDVGGCGLAETQILDVDGRVGAGCQTLVVEEVPSSV